MSKLWGARFKGTTDKLADQFSFSISFDYRLAEYDVIVSQAHAKMLGACKIISRKESAQIVKGLHKIGQQIDKGTFKFDPKAEDVHTNIQQSLKKLIGSAADKLHTARSRNDLVVTDMKLYCLVKLSAMADLLTNLQRSIVTFADKNKTIIIPAYTHLQAAQVVLLAHHLLAYVEMLERDKGRIYDCIKRTNSNPLGSCALSGTSLPINRNLVTKSLGLSTTTHNSIDSVSDRDFIAEALSHLAILSMHCSRIAEDLILWSTKEFNFINIDWSLCTGSSIMPHKKNPDILELIRGETAKVYGNLMEILVLLKGMPLTYNRDFQLDKPPLFESVEKSETILMLLSKTFETLKIKKASIDERIQDESFFSVDIMEYLIKKGASYRDAHDAVGRLTKEILDAGESISNLSAVQLKRYHPKLGPDVKKLLNPETSVKIKQSIGSTNPLLVQKELSEWKKLLS